MKKILLISIVLLTISVSCLAQTEKGKTLLGGSVSFSSIKSGYTSKKSSFIYVMPSVGYFIADNLVIGGGIGYGYNNSPARSNSEYDIWSTGTKSNNFMMKTFGRYYVSLTPEIKFFSELSGSMNLEQYRVTDKSDRPLTADKLKNSFYNVRLSPGFAIFPSRKIGIELYFTGFQYRKDNTKQLDLDPSAYLRQVEESHSRTFEFGANFFAPHLGVQFYF